MKTRIITAVTMIVAWSVMWGQTTPSTPATPPPATGTVTGHVTCSDTQKPARFADVYLFPVAQTLKGNEWAPRKALDNDEKHLYLVKVHSRLDGSFSVSHVTPGEYYIIANMPGYAVPFDIPTIKDDAPSDAPPESPDIAKLLANVPMIRVAADRETAIDLTMQHGGMIAGRMLYDDGTPATDLFVSVMRVGAGTEWPLGLGLEELSFRNNTMRTQDDGSYRVAGLRPGKYIVNGILWAQYESRMVGTAVGGAGHRGGPLEEIDVYAPANFRKSEAKVIEIKSDEQLSDVNVEVKLDGLHNVRGRLLGGDDRHPVGVAEVQLKDDTGFSREVRAESGEFHFDYVPEGTYTLSVPMAYDLQPGTDVNDWKPLRSFQKAEASVIVGEHDVTVDDLMLAEKKPDVKTPTQ